MINEMNILGLHLWSFLGKKKDSEQLDGNAEDL